MSERIVRIDGDAEGFLELRLELRHWPATHIDQWRMGRVDNQDWMFPSDGDLEKIYKEAFGTDASFKVVIRLENCVLLDIDAHANEDKLQRFLELIMFASCELEQAA